MPRYKFHITLSGEGDTPEEAWLEAVDHFSADPGSVPDDDDIEEEDE